jgi:actin-related protein
MKNYEYFVGDEVIAEFSKGNYKKLNVSVQPWNSHQINLNHMQKIWQYCFDRLCIYPECIPHLLSIPSYCPESVLEQISGKIELL